MRPIAEAESLERQRGNDLIGGATVRVKEEAGVSAGREKAGRLEA